MLDWNTLLFYIKGRLALPSGFIEKADEDLKKWVEITAIREFSDYVPDREWAYVDPKDATYQTGTENVFYFFDDEQLPILGIINYYHDGSGSFATGHPYASPMSFNSVKDFALQSMKANILKPFSYWGFTGKYLRPNKVRILPAVTAPFVIEYERQQPADLRRIPAEHSRRFMDLALAEVMLWIGSIRSHYGDGRLQTPYGEIPLQGDTLKSDGMELKRDTIEYLKEASIPSIQIVTGST